MKVKVKTPFFDRNGLHKRGELMEVSAKDFNPLYMVPDMEKAAKDDIETPEKKTVKKTTRKKA